MKPDRGHALNMGLLLATCTAVWGLAFLSFTILGAVLVWGIIFLCAVVAVALPGEAD